MPRTPQSESKNNSPETKPVPLGKPLLTLGAVAVVAAALAVKAALPSFQSEPQATIPLNVSSLSIQQTADRTLDTAAPAAFKEIPVEITASVRVEAATDPIHTARVVAAVQIPTKGQAAGPSDAARVAPKTTKALPSTREKASAKDFLNQRLAKLKLRRALLAAQAEKKNKAIEISPSEGAVVAETASALAPATVAAVETNAAAPSLSGTIAATSIVSASKDGDNRQTSDKNPSPSLHTAGLAPSTPPAEAAKLFADKEPVAETSKELSKAIAAPSTSDASAPNPLVSASLNASRMPMIDEDLLPIDADVPVQVASLAQDATPVETSNPAAASKRALRNQPELPASSAAPSSSEAMTIASVLYGARDVSRLPMIDEELPPIDAEVPVQVASLTQVSAPAETSNPGAASKIDLKNQTELPASNSAPASSETMTIAAVLYGARNAARLPMIDEELPPIDADVPVQVASLSPANVLPAPSQRPRPLVRSNPVAESKPGAINKPRKPVKAKTKAKTKDKPRQTKSAPVLAYAAPQEPKTERPPFDGIGKLFNGGKAGLPGRSSKIAVYDISAAVVHMPDGSKLKANSGIGHRMNKPKYAYVKNLGPTPPNVYKLRMRERRFHGVEAIRMLPYDVAAMRGRDGMLAHSPLLRKSKGSHGCVAFTHYNKFLRAFKKGKVKTMIVVPNMSQLPKYMALYKERHYASK
ncbi:tlde1 domain-containing protein [Roseibium sp.]|uniref:tlde1 domain-containing protein n=1 Tax=Roseibium sp. TaxID=1936156 RepID=UPI003B5198D1